MKIVVIGGTGLIGGKVVDKLRERGHDAAPASPRTGVDTLTGEGLAPALADAQVVVDVSNSPSFEEKAVMEFFTTSTRNLLAAEADAGVAHHVALSIVGIDRLPDNGYFRAKVAQEQLITQGPIPYSIVRATQFFEFVKGIADAAADGDTVRVPPVLFQPVAADDVAEAVCRAALEGPLKGVTEVAGPDRFRFDELIADALSAWNDPHRVVADPHARYFGSELAERSLVPDEGRARLAETRFDDWLRRSS
ncbi:SDR family oxidoreductase [Nonomuraea sp. SYSU D8015]|uniref:SDR family oxidoreductase n=1 Tax=Nonomuraea sp. SYSU D8015 TaxID=2593644 RepID=UPI001660C35F|nr:SDR family oxidoreductase [Nonomuraea sp. SYSU D8015]